MLSNNLDLFYFDDDVSVLMIIDLRNFKTKIDINTNIHILSMLLQELILNGHLIATPCRFNS